MNIFTSFDQPIPGPFLLRPNMTKGSGDEVATSHPLSFRDVKLSDLHHKSQNKSHIWKKRHQISTIRLKRFKFELFQNFFHSDKSSPKPLVTNKDFQHFSTKITVPTNSTEIFCEPPFPPSQCYYYYYYYHFI